MTILNMDASPPADVPPDDAPSADAPPADAPPAATPKYLNIKVRRPDDTEILFLIKETTPLDRMIKAYCKRSDLNENCLILRLYGRQVTRLDTPLSLDLEDGDSLDAFHDV